MKTIIEICLEDADILFRTKPGDNIFNCLLNFLESAFVISQSGSMELPVGQPNMFLDIGWICETESL